MRSILRIVQLILCLFVGYLNAQVVISESITQADSSAIFEIKSTDKGFLPPRMTMSQRDSILNPANGLSIYCTDCKELQIYTDSVWTNILGQLPKDTFVCGDSILYDGQYYSTVLIGSQCWFAENLNIGSRVTSGFLQLNNSIIEKQCYNNDSINCDIYGGLYTYYEMMNYQVVESSQGICPEGWHIPSDFEFIGLELAVNMNHNSVLGVSYRGTDQGSQLAGNSDLWIPGVLTTNPAFGISGLNVLPSGSSGSSSYSGLGSQAYLWSSSIIPGGNKMFFRLLNRLDPRVFRSTISPGSTFSVRCVQD